jgi:hypothetical protein
MTCCCGPLFFTWIANMTHQILWWQTNFMTLNDTQETIGWVQSSVILMCALLSLFDNVMRVYPKRTTLKCLMIVAAFISPPFRQPWYEEQAVLFQLRWVLMAFMFAVQWFEGYKLCNKRDRSLMDLYLLRICWIPVVKPICMLFIVVFAIAYVISIHGMFAELSVQKTIKNDPESPVPSHDADVMCGRISHDYRVMDDPFVTQTYNSDRSYDQSYDQSYDHIDMIKTNDAHRYYISDEDSTYQISL